VAINSMVSGGCIVAGAELQRSLLFSNVRVETHACVEDSVILPNVRIGHHCRVRRAVIDKGCVVPDGTTIGHEPEKDLERFHVTRNGVVLVTPDMLGQPLHTGE
jgi:glucose-1-phosphate adenylyltransferase